MYLYIYALGCLACSLPPLPEARVVAGGAARAMVDSVARFSGRWHVVVDCLAVQDLQTLQQCVAGMAASGAWLVLSHYNRAAGDIAAAISHQLLLIQAALKSGTPTYSVKLTEPQTFSLCNVFAKHSIDSVTSQLTHEDAIASPPTQLVSLGWVTDSSCCRAGVCPATGPSDSAERLLRSLLGSRNVGGTIPISAASCKVWPPSCALPWGGVAMVG
jgi:hypothetical protein